MTIAELFKQYIEHVFAGKRCEARELIYAAQDRGVPARKLLQKVVWPAMEQVERLYREDELPRISEHMATRINRMIADQLHGMLAREPKNGRRMVVLCGDGESEELGAQIVADLFEAEGWTVWFLGSGVPNDEVLEFLGKRTPDVLCIHGTRPPEVPGVRNLISLIREVGICPDMQVMVVGGVFNRAEGLAEEIRADVYATDCCEALKSVEEHPVRIPRPDVPEPGRRRKRRRTGGRTNRTRSKAKADAK
ncbi:MAG: cobalamin B12-binding domain-containing protein [Planctomycetota bacterium]